MEPPFTLISEPDAATSPFLIISAPGAVGKSALARHIGAIHGHFVWDLAKLKLGDNSFVGTIAQCFGPSKLPEVLQALVSGKECFVLDAFDEAEILSGWERVETFIEEIWSFVRQSPCLTIVLLARSETASTIALALEILADEKRPYLLLEIDYFDEANASQFVGKQVERLALETGNRRSQTDIEDIRSHSLMLSELFSTQSTTHSRSHQTMPGVLEIFVRFSATPRFFRQLRLMCLHTPTTRKSGNGLAKAFSTRKERQLPRH
jgi:hypothetical protein